MSVKSLQGRRTNGQHGQTDRQTHGYDATKKRHLPRQQVTSR